MASRFIGALIDHYTARKKMLMNGIRSVTKNTRMLPPRRKYDSSNGRSRLRRWNESGAGVEGEWRMINHERPRYQKCAIFKEGNVSNILFLLWYLLMIKVTQKNLYFTFRKYNFVFLTISLGSDKEIIFTEPELSPGFSFLDT